MLVQVGIIQFSTDVHIQQPLARVHRDNLLNVMTDMVSRQPALAMQHQFQDALGTCMSGYNVLLYRSECMEAPTWLWEFRLPVSICRLPCHQEDYRPYLCCQMGVLTSTKVLAVCLLLFLLITCTRMLGHVKPLYVCTPATSISHLGWGQVLTDCCCGLNKFVGDAAVVAAQAMQTGPAEASFYAFGVGCAVHRYGTPWLGHMLHCTVLQLAAAHFAARPPARTRCWRWRCCRLPSMLQLLRAHATAVTLTMSVRIVRHSMNRLLSTPLLQD